MRNKETQSSENELRGMDENEIETWYGDNLMTLRVLKEQKPEIYRQVKEGFESDVMFLVSIGHVKKELLEHIRSEKSFEF